MVESHCIYNNLITEQTSYSITTLLPNFLNSIKPKNIVEIGTASGGFTSFLSDMCPNSKIITLETKNFYNYNFKQNVESIICNSNSQEIIDTILKPFIQSNGTTIVFCDGGNKLKDFTNYTPLIKNLDYICVHDYCIDRETFKNEYYEKIWNYCRITESDINSVCNRYELVNVNDELQKGMWRVKQKNSTNVLSTPAKII